MRCFLAMPDAVALPDHWIVPAWPAPSRVRAVMTTRHGGISIGPFGAGEKGGMNLGLASGDVRENVLANRSRLAAHLPAEPAWLHQVHGARVMDAAEVADGTFPEADASWTAGAGRVCAVLVADCMPVLFCDRTGDRVAAAHAGWRGLAGGVLEATMDAAGFVPDRTLAWLGPAIGPACFEVGDDVRAAFVDAAGTTVAEVRAAFVPHAPGKWLADLAALARIRLGAVGVQAVLASNQCTMSDARRFYSYRRDGITGRMAAAIWIAE